MYFPEPDKGTALEGLDTHLMTSENDIFIGRKQELEEFQNFISGSDSNKQILHLYGTGGVGKTFLLHAFHRIALQMEATIYLHLDSEDFLHSPSTLAGHIITMLEAATQSAADQVHPSSPAMNDCFQRLQQAAKTHHLILAIDTYEKMNHLDRWFRDFVLRQLPENVSIVLAGRQPLTGSWIESPSWRRLIKQLEISSFDKEQTQQYLYNAGISSKDAISEYWYFTRGHPLTLSLSVINRDEDLGAMLQQEEGNELFSYLVQRWLSEVADPELQELLEAAAILRHFDQEVLAYVTKEKIEFSMFGKLNQLSFVKRNKRGWALHDLVRSAICFDLKHRKPDRYKTLKMNSAFYYLDRIQSNEEAEREMAEFFYHLDEEMIQSAFFQAPASSDVYIEPVGDHNFPEVENYFERRGKQFSESIAHYYHRESKQTYKHYVSFEHNQKESELIGADYVRKLGNDVCRLVKSKSGETIGVSIIVPINRRTIPHLKKEPVSRAYFTSLTTNEEKEYAVSEDTRSGWFIRMLDCLDTNDAETRSYLLYSLFPLLLSGGRIITSTPIPFFQQLIQVFGFEKVTKATHYDYGPNAPSPTYILDVRGTRLAEYLKQLVVRMYSQEQSLDVAQIKRLGLTPREQEILRLIHQEYSNKAIAKELYITEITVKKHVSSVLKKFQVKNRTQLIKRIMEITRNV
ncbi:LuxR C-terminal-related transcriptional regulator [Halobacillus sp. MO56]